MMPPAPRTAAAILLGDAALVEGLRAVLRDRLRVSARSNCSSRSPVVQHIAAVEENRRRRRPAGEAVFGARQRVGGVVFDLETLRASRIAGAISSARLSLPEPYFLSASVRPATVPGTPTLRALSRDFFGSGLPAASRNMVGVAAAGAVSR